MAQLVAIFGVHSILTPDVNSCAQAFTTAKPQVKIHFI